MKKIAKVVGVVAILMVLLVSCSSQSIKVPTWLVGTWESVDTGEKFVFTENNICGYSKWDAETLNLNNEIAEMVESVGKSKVSIANKNNSSGYTITVTNKESAQMITLFFEKKSDTTFSFIGYEFNKK